MSAETRMLALFDELEQQVEALAQGERQLELLDRSRAEYATVTLVSRLMASVDLTVTVDVAGVGHLTGRLQRTGPDWVLVADRDEEWLIRLAAVRSVAGLSSRSRPDIAWTPTQRLGIGSVLRRLADEAGECLLHTVAGSRHEVRLTRVGADFVEVVAGDRSLVVSLTHLAAVHSRG